MRKVISLSGLLAGLLAMPGLMAPGASRAFGEEIVERIGTTSAEVLPGRKLTDDEVGRLQGALVEMAEKGPADVGGMMALQRRMAEDMRGRLEGMMLAQANPAGLPGGGVVQIPPQAVAQQMEKAAFLGVAATRVDAALRDQLQLSKGMGLLVEMVAKDSPAQTAGILVHDVLVKCDDQFLVNMEQLAVLVRSKKPGDEVKLSVIRGGKAVVVTAKLAEREVPVMQEGAFQLDGGPMVLQFGNGGWQLSGRVKVVNGADGSAVRTLTDGEHEIELTRDKEGKHMVVVKDQTGKEIYRGGWDTAAEKNSVPPELQEKVQSLAATKESGGISGGPDGVMVKFGDNALQAEVVKYERADAEHDIVVTLGKQGRTVVVKDAKTGKVIYDGPAETEEDFKKMPPGIAAKVKKMEEMEK